jgi:hypothetical protein
MHQRYDIRALYVFTFAVAGVSGKAGTRTSFGWNFLAKPNRSLETLVPFVSLEQDVAFDLVGGGHVSIRVRILLRLFLRRFIDIDGFFLCLADLCIECCNFVECLFVSKGILARNLRLLHLI